MKKWAFFILLITAGLSSSAAAIDTLARTREIITSIQKKYAPDKRTDIFNVQVQNGSQLRLVVETTVSAALEELKTSLGNEKIKADVVENMLPAKELGERVYGIVNLSVVNNRLTPANQAELVTQTLLGTPVKILKRQSGYYYVRTPDRYLSWVSAEGIRLMDKPSMQKWVSSEKVVYTEEYGHTYETPSVKSQPISDIVHGDIIRVESKGTDFYKVVYPDNRTAYVPVKSVTPYAKWLARPNPQANQIIDFGKTLMGVPYLWGGTSIKGMDCSGFTKTCYYLNGIILPRDASQQALVGEKVDIYENDSLSIGKCLQNLKSGDLLFFGSRATGKVTHTGIYMGGGKYIHQSGSVHINCMIPGFPDYSDLVLKGLVNARRMLNSVGSPEVTRIDKNPFYSGMF